MLDTIQYTKNEDGSFTKTITGVNTVDNIQNEIASLTATIANFQLGQQGEYSAEVAAAIQNYQAQLAILQG